MYWSERKPYTFTVDLYPDSSSFYQCLLPSVSYLVGTSDWYNVDCLSYGDTDFNKDCPA